MTSSESFFLFGLLGLGSPTFLVQANTCIARDLSTRLGLNQDEGEKWIVNLIRDTRLDAKIDYKEGTVIMNHPPQSVYQQVIEKTKGAFFRTQVLRYVLLLLQLLLIQHMLQGLTYVFFFFSAAVAK